MAAFFEPSIEIGGGDWIGPGEECARGIEELDWVLLIDDALGEAAHGDGQRRGKRVALVLHDDRSALLNEMLETGFGGGERGTRGVSANADDQHVPLREVGGGELVVGEEMRHDAERFDGLGDMIAGSHHVAHAEARLNLHVDFARAELRGLVLVVGKQTGIADTLPTNRVTLIADMRDGLDGVGARATSPAGVTENTSGSVSPAAFRWNSRCAGSASSLRAIGDRRSRRRHARRER